MDAAEVVPRYVKRHSRFQIFEFLAEGIYEPRKAAKVHPKIQIRAFDMACADVCKIRLAADWGWDRLNNFGRPVPIRASVIGFSVNLDELREVHVCPEAFFHRADVRTKTIRRDLDSARHAIAKVSHEFQGARAITLRNEMRDYQFGVRINRNPGIRIAPFVRVGRLQVILFGMDERPKLIQLSKLRSEVADTGIKDALALAPCYHQK